MTGLAGLAAAAALACATPGVGQIDLADYVPGRMATTHMLRSVGGDTYYAFEGPGVVPSTDDFPAFWSRSDGTCTDYQFWTPEGMFYLGWACTDGNNQFVRPELTMPRFWDPAQPWSRTSKLYSTRTVDGVTQQIAEPLTMHLRREEGGLIKLEGGNDEYWEEWWLSHAIPVQAGGCAPGIARLRFSSPSRGQILLERAYDLWVPR